MDLLQTLLSFLTKDTGASAVMPVFELLKNNSFDIKKTLSSLTPENVEPIIKSFSDIKNSPEKTSGEVDNYLNPLSSICDKDIYECLNSYFE